MLVIISIDKNEYPLRYCYYLAVAMDEGGVSAG